MKAFTFVRPTSLEEAATSLAVKGSVLKAGGIDLLDRMKERVDEPDRVIAIAAPADDKAHGVWVLDGREATLGIGALATLAEIAASPEVRKGFPALAEAAGLAASPQIRARATLGGNLFQHTRCGYYRHRSFPCFKRGDETCPVLEDGAVQDTGAILGNRPCASAHPSSLAPVLCASGAMARISKDHGPDADALLASLFKMPRRGIASDIELPVPGVLRSISLDWQNLGPSAYEEIRQKTAFDWALASCCTRVRQSDGKVADAAIWLGSVAPIPWHAEAAEKALVGKPLSDETIRAAADAAVAGATPLPGNTYKVDLVKVVVRRALERLRAMK